ncbi:MAG TPA: hypothetical protein VD966_14885, partial [Pyrinomonadaceae bacterium]|nr:hypothetical protein [Pyrinomonadaceae bacterium]
WSMGSYSFVMKRVLRKPLASDADEEGRACNFKGFTVVIFYRDKDKVNLLEMAAQVAAKLEPTGADVKVKKGNFKSENGHLTFYNGQNEIASKLADCISDIARVTPVDGKESSEANVLFLYLQELPGDAEQASVKK